jgi:hypothetical protein
VASEEGVLFLELFDTMQRYQCAESSDEDEKAETRVAEEKEERLENQEKTKREEKEEKTTQANHDGEKSEREEKDRKEERGQRTEKEGGTAEKPHTKLHTNGEDQIDWRTLFSDGLHFSAQGNALVARLVLSLIRTRITHLSPQRLLLWQPDWKTQMAVDRLEGEKAGGDNGERRYAGGLLDYRDGREREREDNE